MRTNKELADKLFAPRSPKANQVFRFNLIRQQTRDLADTIIENTRESAEQNLALRKLHEALMHVRATIEINED